MTQLTDYIIDHAGVDWSRALSSWAWLLPPELSVWIMNRFGDLFLVFEDGSVHMLDVGVGSLQRVADSRDDFGRRVDEGENARDWFMIPLIDKLVAAGRVPEPGHCYCYVELPVLGGGYTPANTRIVPIPHLYEALGPIHEKLKDLPDGTRVKFDVTGKVTVSERRPVRGTMAAQFTSVLGGPWGAVAER